jgi:hypothetical protein
MGKKKIPSRRKSMPGKHSRRTKYLSVGVIALTVTLALATVVGLMRNRPGEKNFLPFLASAPPPPLPPPANPSKEYIYAGNRLIATEEPAVSLSAPANLIASTLSNLTPSQVQISWSATAGADHYEVERSPNLSTNYTAIANNVTGTSFTDTTVIGVNAYLYRVRAVSAGGALSPYTNPDVATAISFTDDSLTSGSTTVKRDHLIELRLAVNAVRATANQSAASWAEAITAGSTPVRASHITELRTKLDEARTALNLAPCSYTSIALGDQIQKAHFEQLRECVK